MIVKELIETLQGLAQEYGEDKEILFSYDYGDHGHTMVASEISNVDVLSVKYSDYHSMKKLTDDEDDGDETERAIILQ